jgi:hypothetical protein
MQRIHRLNENFVLFLICLLLVLVRFLINESTYFRLDHIPSHDISGGAASFAPTVHSFELTGEPAYWSPASVNGFALYYQSFTLPPSPLANSPVLFIWASSMRILRSLNIYFPEYFQYLTLVYLIYPFLSLFFLAKLVQLLFRKIPVTFIILDIYFFTSMAAWQNAWFSYTESIAVFFLAWVSVKLLKSPSVSSYFLFLAGVLYQMMTVNYWTVNNIWVLSVCILTGIIFYHGKIAGAVRKIISRGKFIVISSGIIVLLTGLIWLAGLFSVIREQTGNYIRPTAGGSEYSVSRIMEIAPDMIRFYAELINPFPRIAEITFPANNIAHNTRFLGVMILPVFLLSLFIKWGRRELALLTVIAVMTVICSGTPLSRILLEYTPAVKRIQQIFEYNTWSVQLFVLMLFGSLLSRILAHPEFFKNKPRIFPVFVILFTALIMISIFPVSRLLKMNYRYFSVTIGYSVLLQIISAGLLVIFVIRKKTLFLVILIILLFFDSIRYFSDIETKDRAFTEGQYLIQYGDTNFSDAAKQILNRPWTDDPARGFPGGITSNLPITNLLWPYNSMYLENHLLQNPVLEDTALKSNLTSGRPVEFMKVFNGDNFPHLPDLSDPGFSYSWNSWGYNDHDIKISAPADGYIILKLIPDPLWKITIDDQLVSPVSLNQIVTVLDIKSGVHRVILSYQPFIRRIYLPLMYFTVGLFAALFILSRKFRRSA